MAKQINSLVYKYGGDQPAVNHLISIATKRIARSGKPGRIIPANKNLGDQVFLLSEAPDGRFMITLGTYIGVDSKSPDVWRDRSSKYDRSCVEIWEPGRTIIVDKNQVSHRFNNGTYNDNGRNVDTWLNLILN
jgi:hypothetical protein